LPFGCHFAGAECVPFGPHYSTQPRSWPPCGGLIGSCSKIAGAGGGNRTHTGKSPTNFHTSYGFRRHPIGRLWSGLSLHLASANRRVGAARLVSTPSAVLSRCGLARDRHLTGFPEFEQFCIAGFPASTQSGLSPLRLPIPPRPHCQGGYRLSPSRRQGCRRVGDTGRPVSVSFSGA
jgi:hypothetical protein